MSLAPVVAAILQYFVSAMPTRPAVAAVSLMLFTGATMLAGDAMAQRGKPARGAEAGQGHRHEGDSDHTALSAAVRRVERRTGGQVLSAERVPYDGRDINRVKVVDSSGRVRVFVDDPRGRGAGNEPRERSRRTRDDDN